jgi:hypothetical protein
LSIICHRYFDTNHFITWFVYFLVCFGDNHKLIKSEWNSLQLIIFKVKHTWNNFFARQEMQEILLLSKPEWYMCSPVYVGDEISWSASIFSSSFIFFYFFFKVIWNEFWWNKHLQKCSWYVYIP